MNLTRGDTGAYKFQRRNSSGQVITVPPDEMYFTVKTSFRSKNYVFQKTINDMTMDNDGTWHILIAPEDTADLDYGTYVYDIEVTVIGGNYVQTIAKGTLEIEEESTWENNK